MNMHICVSIYIYICMYVYTFMNIYTYVQVYIHILILILFRARFHRSIAFNLRAQLFSLFRSLFSPIVTLPPPPPPFSTAFSFLSFLPPSLPLCLPPSLPASLPVSLSPALSPSLPLSVPIFLPSYFSLSLSLAHTHLHTHAQKDAIQIVYTRTHIIACTYTLAHTHTYTHTHTLSLTHTQCASELTHARRIRFKSRTYSPPPPAHTHTGGCWTYSRKKNSIQILLHHQGRALISMTFCLNTHTCLRCVCLCVYVCVYQTRALTSVTFLLIHVPQVYVSLSVCMCVCFRRGLSGL